MISDNFKLKGKELFYLIIVTLPPLLLLFVPNYAAIFIGIDSWMIFVLIAAIDMVFAYITVKIGMLAKGKTVIGMCKYAFGNMIGTFFGALFVLLFGFKSLMFFRQSLEYAFMSTYTLEPIYYFAIPMIIVLIYGQFGGTNNVVRLSNIVFWLMIATYFLVMLSAVRNFDINSLRPVMVNGVEPVINSLPHFFTWSGNTVVLLMLFNKTNMTKGVMKYVMSACGIAYAVIIALTVFFIGVFGVIAAFVTTSVTELSLFLNSKVFFNNFDSAVKLIWIFGALIRDCIFISCTVDALTELLNLTNNKMVKIILPLLLTVPAVFLFRNEEKYFMTAMGLSSIMCAVVQYGCVFLLFIGLIIKNKNKEAQNTQKAVEAK